jgi:hypothetical protein
MACARFVNEITDISDLIIAVNIHKTYYFNLPVKELTL